jgi:hypothetical protein
MNKSEVRSKAIEENVEKEPLVITLGGRDLQNLCCEWCSRSIEIVGEQKQEFDTKMRIPIPKDHPEPEQFIEDTLSRCVSPGETIVKIREGAVEIVYCFCSKQHKNNFKAYFRKKGNVVKLWSTSKKRNMRVVSTKKNRQLRTLK